MPTTLVEVLAVLDGLEQAGCRCWLEGGWGVDALAGRQTREHRDVDVDIDDRHEQVALDVLARLGYVVETDWRPRSGGSTPATRSARWTSTTWAFSKGCPDGTRVRSVRPGSWMRPEPDDESDAERDDEGQRSP